MNKFLILLTVAGLVFGFSSCSGKVVVNSVKETETQTSPEEVQENVVYFSANNGFEPQIVSLSQGEELTIVNNSNEKIILASDPHPKDNTYRPLNSAKPIYPNSSFKVIFDEVGEFGYHNEYNTSQVGKVKVNNFKNEKGADILE